MNILCKAGMVMSCAIFTAMGTKAQAPPPPPNGLNAPPPPQRPGPGPERPLQQLSAISGTLTDYLSNDRYEYDGFTLQNSGQTITVRFPAHMGEQLMRTAKKGSAITVQGFYDTSPQGVNEFHLVSVSAGGVTVGDTPPTPPITPQTEEQKNFSGTIKTLRRNVEGVTDGVMISDNQVIELPLASSIQLQPLLAAGASVSGTGTEIVRPAGVVTVRGMETIRAQTLTLNGQTYLVR